MSEESEWVSSEVKRLQTACDEFAASRESILKVGCSKKLPYLCEILRYGAGGKGNKTETSEYETDLIIYDEFEDKSWIPRVIMSHNRVQVVQGHDTRCADV
jgi:hypothetical protein